MNIIIKCIKVCYIIFIFLFFVIVFNYVDCVILFVVVLIMSKELGFDLEVMGLVFFLFGIVYVIM